jgi:hypothetical protein
MLAIFETAVKGSIDNNVRNDRSQFFLVQNVKDQRYAKGASVILQLCIHMYTTIPSTMATATSHRTAANTTSSIAVKDEVMVCPVDLTGGDDSAEEDEEVGNQQTYELATDSRMYNVHQEEQEQLGSDVISTARTSTVAPIPKGKDGKAPVATAKNSYKRRSANEKSPAETQDSNVESDNDRDGEGTAVQSDDSLFDSDDDGSPTPIPGAPQILKKRTRAGKRIKN